MRVPVLTLIGIPESPVTPLDAAAELRAALERHHAECTGWAMACCGFDRSEASDVLQESYLKVLDGRAVFRGASSFRTWLFGVVRHTASEHRRNVFRRFAMHWRRDKHDVAAETQDPDGSIDSRALADRLRRALMALPTRQRQVLHLVFQDGMTVQAAAEVMGVSVGSARTHYARGKARLRELLQEQP